MTQLVLKPSNKTKTLYGALLALSILIGMPVLVALIS